MVRYPAGTLDCSRVHVFISAGGTNTPLSSSCFSLRFPLHKLETRTLFVKASQRISAPPLFFPELFPFFFFFRKSSRIFSSGRFQEEEAANARDSELSFARAATASSNGSIHGSLGSSGSSSEVLERVGSSRCVPTCSVARGGTLG